MRRREAARISACLVFTLAAAAGQDAIAIHVRADQKIGSFKPIYRYFGYDEANYTYTANGRRLLHELAALSAEPVSVRTHFLLTSGDGTPDLKWGSTNAYSEDAAGHPVYDWKIVDRILDAYLQAGIKPFVEIGFMPEALSSHPEPYRPVWAPGSSFDRYYAGWSWPPKDYAKWSELVAQWVHHCAIRYGRAQAESWFWEVWNEPDIGYWHGSPEEYDKLYDASAAAVKRELPGARIGGPANTGPASPRAAAFLRQFLAHCASAGTPLDFISFHAKGRPAMVDGHVRMGIANQARDVQAGFAIIHEFPNFRNLPVVLSESDPEGCAACSARVYPPNAYRNGPLYAVYTAVMMKTILELAERDGVNIEGMLTWAFEFESQPWFDGFRTLATNGVDKPVLNFFRMAGLMQGDRVRVESTGATDLQTLVTEGVRRGPDVDALATRSDRNVSILVWNYHDDDVPAVPGAVRLMISGIPSGVSRVLVRHARVDENHSNAYTLWKRIGSPQQPTPVQYSLLEAGGHLGDLTSPEWISVVDGQAELHFDLPRQALSLVQLSW